MTITIEVSDLEIAELRKAIADYCETLADEAYTVSAQDKEWYETRITALDDLLARLPQDLETQGPFEEWRLLHEQHPNFGGSC